jgi:hypothetical protein
VKILITGTDDHGRSCVVRETTVPEPKRTRDRWAIHTIGQVPEQGRPPGRGEDRDLGVGTGQLVWVLSRRLPDPPGQPAQEDHHHTDTTDMGLLLQGSVTLVLDDGDHDMVPGDAVVINGVDHHWRAGPEGYTLSWVIVGRQPFGANVDRRATDAPTAR